MSAADWDIAAGNPHTRSPKELPRLSAARMLQAMRSVATLSEVLRVLGAGAVLASMSLYLLQGWHAGNDVQRYLLLLAQTGLLTMAGFAMSHGLNEPRSARVFFGLALVSVPANFTILGALLYSVTQWDGALGSYPAFATWRIEDLAITGATVAFAIAALVPVAMFCFAIMARRSARQLAVHFVLLNALLLLPVRSSVAAGAIAMLGVAYALWASRRLLPGDPALLTAEGRFALGTLYIPMGIVLFRSCYFYDVDNLMVALLAAVTFLALRQASLFPERSRRVAAVLDSTSLPVAAVAAVSLADVVSPALGLGLVAPLAASVFAALGIDVLMRSRSPAVGTASRSAVCLAVLVGFGLNVAAQPSATTAILAIAAGASLLTAGRYTASRTAMLSGVLTLVSALVFGLEPLLDLVMASTWYVLAMIGAAAIAIASVVDRHGAALAHRARSFLKRRDDTRIRGQSPNCGT